MTIFMVEISDKSRAEVTEEWVSKYDGPAGSGDQAYAIVTDSAGNVYITGESIGNGTEHDYATVAYDSSGKQLWSARYTSPGKHRDVALNIALSPSGNIIVSGWIGEWLGRDYATIAYDSNGNELWVSIYNGTENGDDTAVGMAVDDMGKIYVTGFSYGPGKNNDYATVAYDSLGNELWVARYNGPANSNDFAKDVTVDASGIVYVTGWSYGTQFDYVTVAYDQLGNELWVARYNGPGNNKDFANDIELDPYGNVIVTGRSYGSGTHYDFATVAYDSLGNELWVSRYDGPMNAYESARAMAIDSMGNIYVTGHSWMHGVFDEKSSVGWDYAIVAYDKDGNELWVASYNGWGDQGDNPLDIALDSMRNVYVTGWSRAPGRSSEFATVAYDANGNLLWNATYDGPGYSSDYGHSIAIDSNDNVYVTGQSMTNGISHDYTTIKYSTSSSNQIPVADAGHDQTISIGEIVFFSGIGSWDPDGLIVNYTWDFGGGNFGYGMNTTNSYLSEGTYNVTLIVTDNDGFTGVDTCNITVLPASEPPYADGGPDQTVNEGEIVTLDGSGSIGSNSTFIPSKNGLVSWWQGDGNTEDIIDGNHGTLEAGAHYKTGMLGQSFSFDGVDDYIDCGNNANLKITGSLTVEVLVKYPVCTGVSGTGTFPNIVSNADYCLSSHPEDWNGYFLSTVRNYPDPMRDGIIRFSVLNPNQAEQVQSLYPQDDGKWHHVVGVFEPNLYISLYVDGVMVANKSTSFSSSTPGIYPFSIGRGSENDFFHYFKGEIDEVAIYNRAITSKEIKCHYKNVVAGQNYFTGCNKGGEIVSYEWDFNSDGIYDYQETTTSAPDGTFDGKTSHTYGDNGYFTVTLRITDENGEQATDTCNISVLNVDPIVEIESAIMDVEIGLRVAGRKFNDVGMTLSENEKIVGYVSIERMPGSPDDQMAWIPMTLDMTKTYSATVTYTPEDPPNIGGNPVWIYVQFPNGSIVKIHHTFNVQQSKNRDSDHWNHVEPWEVDLNAELVGSTFELNYHIMDHGSDDETLNCLYGTQNMVDTYLNNPPNPDPYPSPEINPRDIYDTAYLVYEGPGTLALQVEDDDGGVDSSVFVLS
jgi:hypothetical protein